MQAKREEVNENYTHVVTTSQGHINDPTERKFPPSHTYLVCHGVERHGQEGERHRERKRYRGIQEEVLHVVGGWLYPVQLVTPALPGIENVVLAA